MLDRCQSIYLGFTWPVGKKKAGTEKMVPALSWLVARIKSWCDELGLSVVLTGLVPTFS
jgi:hypothetical protein